MFECRSIISSSPSCTENSSLHNSFWPRFAADLPFRFVPFPTCLPNFLIQEPSSFLTFSLAFFVSLVFFSFFFFFRYVPSDKPFFPNYQSFSFFLVSLAVSRTIFYFNSPPAAHSFPPTGSPQSHFCSGFQSLGRDSNLRSSSAHGPLNFLLLDCVAPPRPPMCVRLSTVSFFKRQRFFSNTPPRCQALFFFSLGFTLVFPVRSPEPVVLSCVLLKATVPTLSLSSGSLFHI